MKAINVRTTILVSVLNSFYLPYAWGKCSKRQQTDKVVKIESCEVVDPYQVPRLNEFAERYPEGFVESYRKRAEKEVQGIMESYRGAILIEKEGENTVKYFLPSEDREVCNKFDKGKVIDVVIGFACCDGDPNPPCYLGLGSYVVKVGEAGVK